MRKPIAITIYNALVFLMFLFIWVAAFCFALFTIASTLCAYADLSTNNHLLTIFLFLELALLCGLSAIFAFVISSCCHFGHIAPREEYYLWIAATLAKKSELLKK